MPYFCKMFLFKPECNVPDKIDNIEIVNCLLCGEGKSHWDKNINGYKCPTCEGDPLIGNGQKDWKDFNRAKFIMMYGPRMEGDEEIFSKYREELSKKGW
mgnify:CR=1 FL=1